MRTVDEIEKSVYDAQALRSYYSHSPARLKKIEGIIKLAAKQESRQFIRQSLGYALYTTIEIEKKKKKPSRRRKRSCSLCMEAMMSFMHKIKKEIGEEKFEEFIGEKAGKDKATLMFAIDDTGSMSGEIQAAKDIAAFIVKYPRNNLEVDYILSPFNDPGLRSRILILLRRTSSSLKEQCYGFSMISRGSKIYPHLRRPRNDKSPLRGEDSL